MKLAWIILLLAAPLGAQAPVATPAPAQDAPSAAPAPQTLDSILSATENLNSIRDGYLRRLAGDGCAPDVAVRVAELRAQLRARAGAEAKKAPTAMSSADLENSLLVLAVSWYTWRPVEPAPAKSTVTDMERNRLLSSVLAQQQPAQAGGPQPDGPAQLNAELERLLESCRAAKR